MKQCQKPGLSTIQGFVIFVCRSFRKQTACYDNNAWFMTLLSLKQANKDVFVAWTCKYLLQGYSTSHITYHNSLSSTGRMISRQKHVTLSKMNICRTRHKGVFVRQKSWSERFGLSDWKTMPLWPRLAGVRRELCTPA